MATGIRHPADDASNVVLPALSTRYSSLLSPWAGPKLRCGWGAVGSWLVQVPCVWASLQFWRADIIGLYTGVSAGYIVMIGALGIFLRNASWQVSVRGCSKEGGSRPEERQQGISGQRGLLTLTAQDR